MALRRVYHHPTQRHVEIPQMDLLTFLFDSEYSMSEEDTILHQEAANKGNLVTKATLRDLSARIAHGMRNHYGVGIKGPNKDVVTVIRCFGQVLIPAVLYGVIAAGGVYSAASPSSTLEELKRQVDVGTSRLIICGNEHKDLASEVATQCGLPLRNVLVLDSSAGKWGLRSIDRGVNALSTQTLEWPKITDPTALKQSLIIILWSSGTTGLPKGVMMSHLNFVAETYIASLSARALAQKQKQDGIFVEIPKRTLAHLPMSHIAGFLNYLTSPVYSGTTVVWMRKYVWADFLRYAQQYEPTALFTVPSIWLRISKSPEVWGHFKHLIRVSTGAAPMDGGLMKNVNKIVGDGTQKMIGQTWGLSETTGAVTAMPAEESDDTGSISPILPGIELRLVDENFNDVDPDRDEGELIVRGPVVTNGYFNNVKATEDAFHDGWFCSGDIAVMRDNKFYVVDRKKELLKYKGLQVAPAEIENLLFQHPKIREAAVVGVPAPDSPGTDLPRAYVVPVDRDSNVSENEVKKWIADRLAPYKQLRGGVAFIDEIPKNAIGKFLRRELREKAKKELQRASKL